MHDANTPKIVDGCISQCVNLLMLPFVFATISFGLVAIKDQLCSSGSIYSRTDLLTFESVNKSFQTSSDWFILFIIILYYES